MQASCGKCGAAVEWESVAEEHQETSVGLTEPGVCDVCGHINAQTGMYCESCGARLGTVAADHAPGAKPKEKEQKKLAAERPKKNRKKQRASQQKKMDPLTIGAVVVVIAIIGYFGYSEITRETPKVTNAPHESLAPETASLIKEVERLQSVVDANPKDAASLLRLANTLHDLSLHDARLLMRAIDSYDRYLSLKPDDPDARVDLGIVCFELARVDSVNARQLVTRAIREMEIVATAHPGHQPAAFNLGIVNLNSGNTDESAKWFKKAVAINENSDLGARAKRLLEQHSFPTTN